MSVSNHLCARERITEWIKAAPKTKHTEALLAGLSEGSMGMPELKLLQLLCKTIDINAIMVNVYTRGDLLTVNCEKYPEYNNVLKKIYSGITNYYIVPGMIAMGAIYTDNYTKVNSPTSAFHLFHGDELKYIEAHYEVLNSY